MAGTAVAGLAMGFVVALAAGMPAPAHAAPIVVEMTTSNGTVPGTGISYTIGIVGDNAGPRNIFPAASSDHDVWTWPGSNPNFPEFYSFGQAETLTVSFSAPVPLRDVVFGLNSTSASTSLVSLAGGTATLSDINLSDSIEAYTGPTGAAVYDSGTGTVTAAGQNQSLMLGSTSGDTITSFTLAAGASDGGADGYTVFVGFRQVAVPEPATLMTLASGLCFLAGLRRRSRRSAR